MSKEKETKLSENQLLMNRLIQLDEENTQLKKQLVKEATMVRIPNELNAHQFNEIAAHLVKIRQRFVEALENPFPDPLDILEPEPTAEENSIGAN